MAIFQIKHRLSMKQLLRYFWKGISTMRVSIYCPLNNVIPVVSSTQMNKDDIDHRMSIAPPSHIILAHWHFAGKQGKQLYGQFHNSNKNLNAS